MECWDWPGSKRLAQNTEHSRSGCSVMLGLQPWQCAAIQKVQHRSWKEVTVAKRVDAAVKASFASACSGSKLKIATHKDLRCLKMPDECSDKWNTSQLTAGGFSPPDWDAKKMPQKCGGGKQRGARFRFSFERLKWKWTHPNLHYKSSIITTVKFFITGAGIILAICR